MDSVITQVTKPGEGHQEEDPQSGSLLRRRFPINSPPPQVPSTPPPGERSNVKPKKSSSIFTKLLNCWCCCGRSKRTGRRRGTTEDGSGGSSQGINSGVGSSGGDDHLLQRQNNGVVGVVDNQQGDGGSGEKSNGDVGSGGDHQGGRGSCNSPPLGGYLLPEVHSDDCHKPCMVIDLDETLVHSSFKPIGNADFVVPVEIDGVIHQVYVAKRPYVDEFLQKMGELYECVLFTASLAKYADPVADLLDKWGVFRSRLFRDACVFHRGNYVKDLNKLGRSLQRVVIVDNSPASYIFHPDNAVPVASWFDDISDTELLYLIPFFERLSSVDNVYTVLRNSNHPFNNALKDAPNNSMNNSKEGHEEEKESRSLTIINNDKSS